jgi:hypothetical protein
LKIKSLVLTTFELASSEGRLVEGPIVITKGETLHKIGIQIRDGSGYVWHLPGLKDRRYSIKAVIIDATTNKRIREFSTNRLHSYGRVQKGDVEKDPTVNTARNAYYGLYTISENTFNGKCGKYLINITVLNPSGDVVYERPKPVEIQLIPKQVARIEIINSELKIRIGETMPS